MLSLGRSFLTGTHKIMKIKTSAFCLCYSATWLSLTQGSLSPLRSSSDSRSRCRRLSMPKVLAPYGRYMHTYTLRTAKTLLSVSSLFCIFFFHQECSAKVQRQHTCYPRIRLQSGNDESSGDGRCVCVPEWIPSADRSRPCYFQPVLSLFFIEKYFSKYFFSLQNL